MVRDTVLLSTVELRRATDLRYLRFFPFPEPATRPARRRWALRPSLRSASWLSIRPAWGVLKTCRNMASPQIIYIGISEGPGPCDQGFSKLCRTAMRSQG